MLRNFPTIDFDFDEWLPKLGALFAKAFFLLLLATGWGNAVGYFQPFDLCFINTESAFSGTGQTKRAIWHLRQTDRDAYKILCREVEIITEDSCYSDSSGSTHGNVYGCFIRGSRIITIPIQPIANDSTLRARAAVLGQLAQQAMTYWSK